MADFWPKIAFLHANITFLINGQGGGGMIFQREERTYLSMHFYIILSSLPISDDQGPSSIEGTSTV